MAVGLADNRDHLDYEAIANSPYLSSAVAPDSATARRNPDQVGAAMAEHEDLEHLVQRLPEDPDIGVDRLPPHRQAWRVICERRDILLAVSLGGALGSLGRWGVAEALPHDAGSMAWSTLLVNVTGSLALGLLMAFMADLLAHTRLVRPFLGVGVCGGWTTFSSAMLDTHAMLDAGRVPLALFGYLGATLIACVAAVWVGLGAGRLIAGRFTSPAGEVAA